ncbi:MAG: hypothetical protein GY920_21120 [Aliivibrio sp.]|nr:hypothetical protein [Aliivibrio sp.]MCP4323342.1 hypothetical protein [Alteromonadales bacterium]
MSKQDEHIINDLSESLRGSNKSLRKHIALNGVLFFVIVVIGLIGWSMFL